MKLQAERRSSALVVTPLFTRLDAAEATTFRTEAAALVEDQPLVVVDASNLTFVDSSGLGALVAVLKRLPPGGRMRLASAGPALKALLAVTRLQAVLPVFPSVEAALQP